jgi:hypothetical protein
MGWGLFSDEFVIVAAETPEQPLPPVTEITNVNVRIAWQ